MTRPRLHRPVPSLRLSELLATEVASRARLQALSELASELSLALDRASVGAVVVAEGSRAMQSDTCSLYVLDASGGALLLVADRGIAPEVLERVKRIDADPAHQTWRTVQTGESLWVETEQQYRALYPGLAQVPTHGARARAFWSVPLVVEGRPMGLLAMGFYEERAFSPAERAFVEAFTRQCAQALKRAEHLEAERNALVEAVRARNALATTLRSIGDAVIATDAHSAVTFMNPVAEALTGWPTAEAQGRPLREVFRIVNEATREPVESPVERVLREGRVVGLANHTVLLNRQPGLERPIADSGAPIRDEAGELLGVVLVFRDVTEEKAVEDRAVFLGSASAALASSLDYKSTLARVAQLAVPRLADWCSIELLEDGRSEQVAVAHVDPAKVEFAQRLGERYPPDPNAATGAPNVQRTGRSELYPELPRELLLASAVNEEHKRLILELQLSSALCVPIAARGQVLGTMTLIFAESGRRYSQEDLLFAEDFARRAAVAIENARLYASEQRERERADASNSAKDEFLATVSHELRTPLNAILGWARMLSAGDVAPEKQPRALEVIARNAVAMAQLIEDLLDVSRIVSGKVRLEVRQVDPAALLQTSVDAVKPLADSRSIDLRVRLEAPGARVLGDSSRLQQVVWNLLHNAVKFSHKGGLVEAALRADESTLELQVRDEGRGIAAAFLPHMFDRFRQADSSSTRKHGGLGLGLAISRHLVELHGGQLEAHSDGEGKGATFVVKLPLDARALAAAPEHDSKPPPLAHLAELVGVKVLVVDDEADSRGLVRAVLESSGAEVTEAGSADEALALLEGTGFDVLLSDIAMPGQNGYELLRRVRALPADRGGLVPAAALTAYASPEDRRAALSAGFAVQLDKPVDAAQLLELTASLARIARSQRR